MIPVRECKVVIERGEFYKCDKCPKAFLNIGECEEHMKYHNLSDLQDVFNPYVKLEKVDLHACDYCRRGFLSKTEVLLHSLEHIHKSVKKAKRQETLNKFFEDTTIEKPYKCPECDYRFVAESTLIAHSVVHQPFPNICHCGIGYYKLEDLEAHEKLMHEIKIEKKVSNKISIKASSSEIKDSDTERQIINDNQPLNSKNKVNIRKYHPKIRIKKENPNKSSSYIAIPELDALYNEALNEFSLQPLDINIERVQNTFKCPECMKCYHSHLYVEEHYRNVHQGQRPYPCHICKKNFSQRVALKMHLIRHIGLKPYKCKYCDKNFPNAGQLQRHERIHTGVKPFVCCFCRKAFSDQSAHIRHERIHMGDKRYRCVLCPKAFTDHSALYAHKKRHAKLKEFTCEHCDKKFYCYSSLRKHVDVVHKQVYNFICDYCDKRFGSKGNLMIHIKCRHMGMVETATCPMCFITIKKVRLRDHIKVVHENIKKYVCDYCSNQYADKAQLKDHIACHTWFAKFICDICLKEFPNKKHLRSHIYKTHMFTRCKLCRRCFMSKTEFNNHKLKVPERCDVCDKKFYCKKSLDSHFRQYHILKKQDRYQCDYCKSVFNTKSDILRHMQNIHLQLKPRLLCEHCGQKFRLKCEIRYHMMSKHLVAHKCDICSKKLYSRVELNIHKESCSSSNKLECDVCNKKFAAKNSLKAHKALHTDNRVEYSCPFCSKTVLHKQSLLKHLTSHEKNKVRKRRQKRSTYKKCKFDWP